MSSSILPTSLRALVRLGFGGRRGDEPLRDPRGWALAQVSEAPPLRPAPLMASDHDLQVALGRYREAVRVRNPSERRARVLESRRELIRIQTAESVSSLGARIVGTNGYAERLVAFWSNHLCVAAPAGRLVGPLAGSYERLAIRPHLFARYEEMVLASARHPAMLLYLDNAQSTGPNSSFALRRGVRTPATAPQGLNENYARELLELHTLGVDGGYNQRDVTELARLLTGWSIEGQDGRSPPRFAFIGGRHDPGVKTVLGERYNAGEEEGERAIRWLCRHPATARFIATKLAIHFVSDTPPRSAVDRLERVFLDTQGDLRAVSAEIVLLPEVWDAANVKFRSPQDWLVAALRAVGVVDASAQHLGALRQLRHPYWAPISPKGFGDLQREWADPDALLNRAEYARTLARRSPARNVDFGDLGTLADARSGSLLATTLADSRISVQDRLALAIASPNFQWR